MIWYSEVHTGVRVFFAKTYHGLVLESVVNVDNNFTGFPFESTEYIPIIDMFCGRLSKNSSSPDALFLPIKTH